MISEEDKIMMETLYWWGIPTLFRCKNDPDPKNCDIALVGVPHSTGNGTTERDQHLGPRAVRNISAMLKRSHFDYKLIPGKKIKFMTLVMFLFLKQIIMKNVLNEFLLFMMKLKKQKNQSCLLEVTIQLQEVLYKV